MAKTFPIKLEVEEIALGTVLRKLNDMPGIAKLHLDLERGGEGAGRKQLEDASKGRNGNGNNQQNIVKLLLQGPKHITEIARSIGGNKSSAYTATSIMRTQGLIEAGPSKGTHQLTAAARAQLGGAPPALPAPDVKRGPKGRAVPGSGPIILRTVLEAGPKSPTDLRKHLAENGMSAKSISGVLDRARKQGLVKKNGANLYELTAKGQKIEMTGASNG